MLQPSPWLPTSRIRDGVNGFVQQVSEACVCQRCTASRIQPTPCRQRYWASERYWRVRVLLSRTYAMADWCVWQARQSKRDMDTLLSIRPTVDPPRVWQTSSHGYDEAAQESNDLPPVFGGQK